MIVTRYISITSRITGWNAVKSRVVQLGYELTDDQIKEVYVVPSHQKREKNEELTVNIWKIVLLRSSRWLTVSTPKTVTSLTLQKYWQISYSSPAGHWWYGQYHSRISSEAEGGRGCPNGVEGFLGHTAGSDGAKIVLKWAIAEVRRKKWHFEVFTLDTRESSGCWMFYDFHVIKKLCLE